MAWFAASPAHGRALTQALLRAQVRGSNKALSADFNITSYPTLLAICNGDPALAERYSGDLKSEKIASFLVRPAKLSCGVADTRVALRRRSSTHLHLLLTNVSGHIANVRIEL